MLLCFGGAVLLCCAAVHLGCCAVVHVRCCAALRCICGAVLLCICCAAVDPVPLCMSPQASPKVQKKWAEIKNMPGGHNGLKNKAKMEFLNLGLVKREEWEDLLVCGTENLSKTLEKFEEGRWYYRGEIEVQMGVLQANRFIHKGKFELGEDSDGDSLYRKVQKGDRKSKIRGATVSTEKKRRHHDAADLDSLMEEMAKNFEDDADIGTVKSKVPKSSNRAKVAQAGQPPVAGQAQKLPAGGEEAGGSRRLKERGSGKPQSSGAPSAIALADIDPPEDPNSVHLQKKAQEQARKWVTKLNDKCGKLQEWIESLQKKSKDAAAKIYIIEARELKTKVAATTKSLNKAAAAPAKKVNPNDVKSMCQIAANHSEAASKLKEKINPLLPKED